VTDFFLDSSALVKRYVPEQGTAWVRAIAAPAAGRSILIAQLTPVEVVSGTWRRVREGTIAPRTARAIRLLVDRHAQRDYLVIGLAAQIVQRAENLLEQHALRAYDAIQLASALESNARLVAGGLVPLTYVAADQRLLTAASAEGLAIDDPMAHP
jgi:predicted nucleic acid-binding protein